ncbi:MAG TPA: oligosaccharide flippase family protein [Alphaproteobacteria bacterium]|nr:oligosaccharide flippase family protein [Alphaproteobacteria bacterium]
MKDIFTSYIAQAIALIANFVGGVLAARLLLPVGRGELGQAMLWPVLIAGLGGLSVGDAIIFFTASRRAAAPRVMGSALGMGAILSLALIPVGFGILSFVNFGGNPAVRSISQWYLLYIPIGYASGYVVNACQAHRRFDLWNFLRVLVSFMYAAIVVVLWITNEATVAAFVAASLLANLTVFVTGAILLRRLGMFGMRPDVGLMKRMFGYGARLHVAALLTLPNVRLDQILITQWLPAADFGYYLVAVSVYTSACSLITLLGSLVFPKMAAAENDAVRAEVLGRYLRLALTLAVTGGIILLLVAPWLITLVYGRPYLPAAGVLQILAVGIAPMTSKFLLVQTFKAVGRPLTVVWAEFISLATCALALIVLIPAFGILGAAASIVLAHTAGFVVLALAVRRHIHAALIPLFTPSTSDVSFVIRRVKDVFGQR